MPSSSRASPTPATRGGGPAPIAQLIMRPARLQPGRAQPRRCLRTSRGPHGRLASTESPSDRPRAFRGTPPSVRACARAKLRRSPYPSADGCRQHAGSLYREAVGSGPEAGDQESGTPTIMAVRTARIRTATIAATHRGPSLTCGGSEHENDADGQDEHRQGRQDHAGRVGDPLQRGGCGWSTPRAHDLEHLTCHHAGQPDERRAAAYPPRGDRPRRRPPAQRRHEEPA